MPLTNFPDGINGGIDIFASKFDEGVSIEESFVIPATLPYQFQLQEIPLGPQRNLNGNLTSSTIFILNFLEVEGTPQRSGQFNVDYNTGILTFHPADTGKSLTVVYETVGDSIMANDYNKISEILVALEHYAIAPWIKSPDGTKWYLKVDNTGVLSLQNQP